MKTKTIIKIFFISHNVSILNLSLNELKIVSKSRGSKGHKSISKERLLSALSESESVESKNSFDDKRLKKIRKDFYELRYRFSKPQMKEIRRNFYDINTPNLSKPQIKEISENLLELEKSLSNIKKYRSQDDFEHKNLREVRNLFNNVVFNEIAFNQSIDEDCYKPVRTKSAFNNNYIEYESKETKIKIYHLKNILI